MQKPTTPITSHADWDYDIFERCARALEHSTLRLRGLLGFVGVPAELGGNPDDLNSGLGFNILLVTDLKRGWLALSEADHEYDWTETIDGVLQELVGKRTSAPWVPRTAVSYPGARPVLSALDLRNDAQQRIEQAFERHFGGAPCHGLDAFDALSAGFDDSGFNAMEEDDIRQQMSESPSSGFSSASATGDAGE